MNLRKECEKKAIAEQDAAGELIAKGLQSNNRLNLSGLRITS